MKYELSPISPRLKRVREKYRATRPWLDVTRYRIVTEFYQENIQTDGILKRAMSFKNLCEKLPIIMKEEELIVGSYAEGYIGAALYPELGIYSIISMVEDLKRGDEKSSFRATPEVIDYILSTADFWKVHCSSSKLDAYIPEAYKKIAGSGVISFAPQNMASMPVGHFCTNYNKAIRVGFKAIKAEAEGYMRQLEETGFAGEDASRYHFYRSICIVCDGIMLFAKRYAAECARRAEAETNPVRKAELERMADTMGWVMENPARDFRDAIQALWFYQMCVYLNANLHGCSIGRVDQYLGSYLEADLASGAITRAEAQELMDLYVMKTAELCSPTNCGKIKGKTSYTNGSLITVGGIDAEGKDATNTATYMMLEAVGRLKMVTPPVALRMNRNAPKELWACALAVNQQGGGGLPSYYSDDVIMKALVKRGIAEDEVWDYCVVGCVEPSLGGAEWPACGGTGGDSFMNLVNVFMMAINDGKNPLVRADGTVNETQFGPRTGYLYEMNSIEEVKEAFLTQLRYWVQWNVNMINIYESVTPMYMPRPVVSATMKGCMEKGKDVTEGGARYNSTGLSAIGLGNVTDCFYITERLCFVDKKCTTRELYDALTHNWEGYEELRDYINNRLPRYGNAVPEVDRYCEWIAKSYADIANSKTGPRGRYSAGLYPVTMNIALGKQTAATPDGRLSGEPLADGISAVQGMDKNGPTSILCSVDCFDHSEFSNGTLLNMKFHPTVLSSEDGFDKLVNLMQAHFFQLGGMQMQFNIVSADTLRDAQKNPENYKDLVVRIAGFSAYFVETFKNCQDDLIRRTELGM